MGNRRGPTFLDLQLVNQFYQCPGNNNRFYDYFLDICFNKPNCKNGGFVNPKKCSECICPSAFGGTLCDVRAKALFTDKVQCGKTITASSHFEKLVGSISAFGPLDQNGITMRQAECHWHITVSVYYTLTVF